MALIQQLFGIILLVGWIGLWWLAVQAVFGNRMSPWEWMPVVFAAFAVPMLLADSTVRNQWILPWMIGAWGAVALAVDLVWLYKRIRRGNQADPSRPRNVFERRRDIFARRNSRQ